ncbi:GPI anchored serine-threonine rich protein [Geosmithia morbida]|uniref:GPI anchored serine-threonine rich protein n=1 Tax=Geosmithia morbida TaxID=1094350 RepID=A0A9P5D489_9HYPO|nr:GPI anchored serine-threonine rich protein [Geosmithia morbida]KAF4125792.1 GPI anchored serine-threonine rich protein [Geosmithia morbida]
MKFFIPLAMLAASVAAQTSTASSDDGCLAENIVKSCLTSETAKADACKSSDFECLCRAYEAIATCYNNCPDDPRAASTKNQVTQYCSRVTTTTPTSTGAGKTTSTAEVSSSSTDDAATEIFSSAGAEPTTNFAAELAANAPGMLVGVAGVVAALL